MLVHGAARTGSAIAGAPLTTGFPTRVPYLRATRAGGAMRSPATCSANNRKLFPVLPKLWPECAVRYVKLEESVMSKIRLNEKLIFDFIKQQYRPYDTHDEFGRGFSAYQAGNFHNPHAADSDSARAWDLGAEAAMRYQRVIAD